MMIWLIIRTRQCLRIGRRATVELVKKNGLVVGGYGEAGLARFRTLLVGSRAHRREIGEPW